MSVVESPLETRALALLSSGVSPEQCASACGVTPGRISQLISSEVFATKLADRRFEALRKHNARDDELDALEDAIIFQFKQSITFVLDPAKLARMLQIVNAAKRRGASAPDQIISKQTVLKLNIPITLINRFTLNGANQVISAGEQDLVTIQSSQMKRLAAERSESQTQVLEMEIGLEGVDHDAGRSFEIIATGDSN